MITVAEVKSSAEPTFITMGGEKCGLAVFLLSQTGAPTGGSCTAGSNKG